MCLSLKCALAALENLEEIQWPEVQEEVLRCRCDSKKLPKVQKAGKLPLVYVLLAQ